MNRQGRWQKTAYIYKLNTDTGLTKAFFKYRSVHNDILGGKLSNINKNDKIINN